MGRNADGLVLRTQQSRGAANDWVEPFFDLGVGRAFVAMGRILDRGKSLGSDIL